MLTVSKLVQFFYFLHRTSIALKPSAILRLRDAAIYEAIHCSLQRAVLLSSDLTEIHMRRDC